MATNNAINANSTSPMGVAIGGTGANTLTIHGLLKGDAAGAVSALPAGTDGQLPIGSTGGDPVMATLTQGSGITITNGPGTITIAASGGGGGITDLEADDTNTASGATVTITGDNQNIFTTANNASALTVSQGPALVLPMTNTTLSEGVITVSGQVVASFPGSSTFLGGGNGNGTLTGSVNIGIGAGVLTVIDAGSYNIGIGLLALGAMDFGEENIAIGHNALTTANSNTSLYNVGIGFGALSSLATGDRNIAIGLNAGAVLTGAETSNIHIGNLGVTAESNTIRIGTEGTGPGEQSTCYIAGIANATVTGSPVLVDTSTGQLGLAVSSERFKERITDMGDRSDRVMQLRPVNFAYKQDSSHGMQWGLIAEEVANVMPELVTYDMMGQPYTVRYNDLPAILLNELQKLQKRVAELEAKCKE